MTSSQPPIIDEVLALETGVWEALVAGDPAADRALLAPDFLGVYPTGFADRNDHTEQIEPGPSVLEYEIREPRLLPFGDDLVLLAYEAAYRRPGDDDPQIMFVSSIWERRAGGWTNVFSQDTPADPSPGSG